MKKLRIGRDLLNNVDNNDQITNTKKMIYLFSLLEGDSKQIVNEFIITELNYKLVLRTLKNRFEVTLILS